MGVTTHRFYCKEDRMRFTKPNNRMAPAVIAGVTIGLLVAGYKFVFANKFYLSIYSVRSYTLMLSSFTIARNSLHGS
mgnify:CR=1 FL=1